MEIITPSNITFALGVIAMMFAVYHSFRNPQINSEKEQIRIEEDIKDKASILSQKEVENKALVLEKQFQWYMDANNQKFADFSERLEKAFLMASNHTHTVDVKVDKLIESTSVLGLSVEKLKTVIEERFPKQK